MNAQHAPYPAAPATVTLTLPDQLPGDLFGKRLSRDTDGRVFLVGAAGYNREMTPDDLLAYAAGVAALAEQRANPAPAELSARDRIADVVDAAAPSLPAAERSDLVQGVFELLPVNQ